MVDVPAQVSWSSHGNPSCPPLGDEAYVDITERTSRLIAALLSFWPNNNMFPQVLGQSRQWVPKLATMPSMDS